MKLLIYFFFTIIIFCSCTDSRSEVRYDDPFSPETCGSWNDPNTTIDELQPADSRTASNYVLSGTCDDNNEEIRIYIEGGVLDEFPRCQRKRWQTSVDLTGIIDTRKDYQIALSVGGRRGRLCEEVKNNFFCPNGYIGVPKLEGFTDYDFCVMKYEARTSNRDDRSRPGEIIKAEARTSGTPITRVTETEAIRYCKENGPGYDLIKNSEWQTIARSIEIVDNNWSRNRAIVESGNRLNIGSTAGIRTLSDDREEDRVYWSYDRRYHLLSNQARIWDFSGHLWEIVQMDMDVPIEGYSGFVYEMPDSLKRLFGPRKDYRILRDSTLREGRNGLGRIYSDSFKGTLIRGGSSQQNSGIFSTDTTKDDFSIARQNVGFRCVYYP